MAGIETSQHNKPLTDNVKRTVAISALRKINGLVRDDQNEERLERKALWIAAAVVGAIRAGCCPVCAEQPYEAQP
jgi:hypothetical protein